jgi:DNA-binding NarL/FixJ family response regulator
MMRIGIAAPTHALRVGLRAMLEATGVQVVAEAATPRTLADDLSSLDGLVLGDASLLDDVLQLRAAGAALALVVLTDEQPPPALLRELPLHGWAIVPDDVAPEALYAALQAAAQGLVVLGSPLAENLLAQRTPLAAFDADEHEEPLTSREQEVLELLSQGLPNKQIARLLTISEHTVKFHISSLYAKLGATSRTDAVSRGARRGLISF